MYLVSTPIGNLEDITLRAVRILQEVDFILAEDSRTAQRLLTHLKISNRIISYHSYNEEKRISQIIERFKNGQTAALIAEAGTPLVSDPGHKVVVAAIQHKIKVVPVPGPSALLAALAASGLPTDRFVFEGFLPRKKGRKKKMEMLAEEPGTIIIYESVYRIEKTVEDIVKILGNRYIVLARELTKKFEEFIRGYAEEVLEELKHTTIKGEFVIIIGGLKFKPVLDQFYED